MGTLVLILLVGLIGLTAILLFVIAKLNQFKKTIEMLKKEASWLNGACDSTRELLDGLRKNNRKNLALIAKETDDIESHMRRDHENIKVLSMLISCVKPSSFSKYVKKDKEFQENLRHLAKLAKHDN